MPEAILTAHWMPTVIGVRAADGWSSLGMRRHDVNRLTGWLHVHRFIIVQYVCLYTT